jgi:hypothetical protein
MRVRGGIVAGFRLAMRIRTRWAGNPAIGTLRLIVRNRGGGRIQQVLFSLPSVLAVEMAEIASLRSQ